MRESEHLPLVKSVQSHIMTTRESKDKKEKADWAVTNSLSSSLHLKNSQFGILANNPAQ